MTLVRLEPSTFGSVVRRFIHCTKESIECYMQMIFVVFLFCLFKMFRGHKSFLSGYWYPRFVLLVMSPLGFKARVGSLIRTWQRQMWYMFPEIHLWCDTCRTLGISMAASHFPHKHLVGCQIWLGDLLHSNQTSKTLGHCDTQWIMLMLENSSKWTKFYPKKLIRKVQISVKNMIIQMMSKPWTHCTCKKSLLSVLITLVILSARNESQRH